MFVRHSNIERPSLTLNQRDPLQRSLLLRSAFAKRLSTISSGRSVYTSVTECPNICVYVRPSHRAQMSVCMYVRHTVLKCLCVCTSVTQCTNVCVYVRPSHRARMCLCVCTSVTQCSNVSVCMYVRHTPLRCLCVCTSVTLRHEDVYVRPSHCHMTVCMYVRHTAT